MQIQKLSSEVIDQIAAGEVVERPAHLVKELVENSLDAGASLVEVEWSEGGRRVRVLDDGSGISAEELPLALERFATSKIRAAEDLWSLHSFGFRGEALASLAAVSKLTIVSRRAGDQTAHRLHSEFGRLSAVEDVGGKKGTTVWVEDLFGNVPARLKFLKTDAAEHSQIRATMKAIALSRPDVEFRFHENGRLWAAYPKAAGARERAQQVLEISPLFEGEAQREGFRAKAVFAPPSEVSKTSRQIWLFAQGRWIQDRGLQAAVMEAYRSLLMHGEYPIAAVWVECEPSDIDVNIHPTKSQVKFSDASLAFRAVQASLRRSLEEAPWRPASVAAPASLPEAVHEATPLRFQDMALETTVFAKKDFGSLGERVVITERPRPAELPNFAPQTPTGPWGQLEVLGQANLTYILCQSEKGLVLVDQHAAHERIVYEKLMASWKGGRIEIQEFLFPLSVEMSPEKVEALARASDDLQKLGVSLEMLGPGSVGVKAGPALLKDAVYAPVLEKTADEILERGGSFSFEKIVIDLCATMACHSVVRAGQALSKEQMQSILKGMDEFPLSGFCPHGRPVSVEFPFARLEKEFGRTV